MAQGIDISKYESQPQVVDGLIRAQQDLQTIQMLNTIAMAKAVTKDAEGFKKTIDELWKLIHYQDVGEEKKMQSIEEQLDELGTFLVQIDPSTIPVAQDRLIPRTK